MHLFSQARPLLRACAQRAALRPGDEGAGSALRAVLCLSALAWAIAGLVVLLTLPAERPPTDASCLERGHATHRQAGHWPFLWDGRIAEEEVARRCARNPMAYGR